ncbi:T9SS C-terminal target domain-containing protein [candidate division KSB1 bacterium]|nr:fibronectin type III domain-containing protein [candidate division KSB1 bacterium]RQW07189.1 MAG: T9SS C-terminal target domain-containing protein [candidate division KSB1 bacterium]
MMRYFLLVILFFTVVTQVYSRAVTLKWNPVDDLILSYRIYWGTESGDYPYSRDVGDRTEYKIENLQTDIRYYFTVTAIDYWGNESDYSNEVSTSGQAELTLPEKYDLMNFPNPFNSGTTFDFYLPEDHAIEIAIYNTVGQKIAVLEQGKFQAGSYRTHWDGVDDSSRKVASGIYFCIFQAGSIRLTRQIALLR